jgi:hypothetical protein
MYQRTSWFEDKQQCQKREMSDDKTAKVVKFRARRCANDNSREC